MGNPANMKEKKTSSNTTVARKEASSNSFIFSWLSSRADILSKNMDDRGPNPNDSDVQKEISRQVDRSNSANVYATGTDEYGDELRGNRFKYFGLPGIQPKFTPSNNDTYPLAKARANGMYYPGSNNILLDMNQLEDRSISDVVDENKDSLESVITHEKAHAMDAKYQENKIRDILKTAIIQKLPSEKDDGKPGKYWDNPSEVYSRMMQFRQDNNIDPKKVFTIDDIKKMKDGFHNIEQRQLLDRYDDKTIIKLLNDVAINNTNNDTRRLS